MEEQFPIMKKAINDLQQKILVMRLKLDEDYASLVEV